mmetsp:Transcript_23586/g.74318  ORF Transcript_23586/g.74318 Transcript_23586/m.74318 type:complete len:432 (-) Transcript_23586:91-1386(-)
MVRVLLCGDLRGRLRQLCEQISKLHSKLSPEQHFAAVFCVGEFSSEGMDWDAAPPVPVHFIDCGPAAGKLIAESPQGCEVRPGVHFLGHYGVARVAGLSVAFLSGRVSADLFTDAAPAGAAGADAVVGTQGASGAPSWEDIRAAERLAELGRKELFVGGCHYTPLTVTRLREEIADSGGVDLLLTSEWPSGCFRGVPKEAQEGLHKAAVRPCSSQAVAEIAASAEPKYHAVGLGAVFWRRPPWTHVNRGEVAQSTGELRCGVCRIVALGAADGGPAAGTPTPASATDKPAGGPKPQKWLHGLDLDPAAPPAQAADATPSPWATGPATVAASAGAGAEGGTPQPPLRPIFEPGDAEAQRRWRERFGILPEEMLSASDKVAKEMQPKEKKEKRQSLYYSQKGEKRFKAGKGGHEGFLQKERRAANGRSVANNF